MASPKHIEKVRAAQLDRIERKLDALLKQAGISLVETAPVVEAFEPEDSEPEGEQPEDKPRTKKK